MKKNFSITLYFIALAIISFVGGMAIAEIRIAKTITNQEVVVLSDPVGAPKADLNVNEPVSGNKESDNLKEDKKADDKSNNPETQKPEDILTFAIIGDTQGFNGKDANGGIQKAVRNISKLNPDLLMTEGDLISSCDNGCENKLNNWKNILGSLAPKTYEVMGNHDRTGKKKADEAWQKVFNLPANGPSGYKELTYSFDNKNSHFVILNSEKPEEHIVNKTQRDWLENNLTANKNKNIFVFFHEPAYPAGHKIGTSLDAEKKERDALWTILEKYKVTAVFNGHEHNHTRRKIGSVYQFIIGNTDAYDHETPSEKVDYFYIGRHYAVVKVAGNKITLELYSVDGAILNSFIIPR